MALLGFDALGRLALGEAPYNGGPRLLGGGAGTAAFKGAGAAVLGAAGGGAASFKGAGAGSFAAKGAAAAVMSIAGNGSFAPVGGGASRLFASGAGSAVLYPPGAARFLISSGAVISLGGSTAWDRMLERDETPFAYFAEIEPWVLTDRS